MDGFAVHAFKHHVHNHGADRVPTYRPLRIAAWTAHPVREFIMYRSSRPPYPQRCR